MAETFGIDTGKSIINAVVNNTVLGKKNSKKNSVSNLLKENTISNASTTSNNSNAKNNNIGSIAGKMLKIFSTEELKGLTWNDLDLDSDNIPLGAFWYAFTKHTFKAVRIIGMILKIPCA